jgi:hypothetical protein
MLRQCACSESLWDEESVNSSGRGYTSDCLWKAVATISRQSQRQCCLFNFHVRVASPSLTCHPAGIEQSVSCRTCVLTKPRVHRVGKHALSAGDFLPGFTGKTTEGIELWGRPTGGAMPVIEGGNNIPCIAGSLADALRLARRDRAGFRHCWCCYRVFRQLTTHRWLYSFYGYTAQPLCSRCTSARQMDTLYVHERPFRTCTLSLSGKKMWRA